MRGRELARVRIAMTADQGFRVGRHQHGLIDRPTLQPSRLNSFPGNSGNHQLVGSSTSIRRAARSQRMAILPRAVRTTP